MSKKDEGDEAIAALYRLGGVAITTPAISDELSRSLGADETRVRLYIDKLERRCRLNLRAGAQVSNWDECERLTAMVADLERQLAERQWLPMDSAPRDGTRILAKAEWGVFVAVWNKYGNHWSAADSCCGFDEDQNPSRWMPLPD